jgi:hypothetical protein
MICLEVSYFGMEGGRSTENKLHLIYLWTINLWARLKDSDRDSIYTASSAEAVEVSGKGTNIYRLSFPGKHLVE